MGGSEPGAAMLAKAQADLQALRHMLDAVAFDDAIFGFHAQQACEKACKAWLLRRGIEPPFVHDLRKLIQMLRQVGVDVPEAEVIADLTDYAVVWRYDDLPVTELLDRSATVALCERLLSRVVSTFGHETG